MKKIKRFFKNLIRNILIKVGIIETIQIVINDDLSCLENLKVTVKGINVIPPAEEIIINDKKAKKVTYKGNGHYDIVL